MISEGLRLLLLSICGWLRTRLAECAIALVAVVFFAVALVLASVAGHEALLPQVGPAIASAIVAGAYLVLGGIAMLGWYMARRRRQRIARATNWAAAVPKVTPLLMVAALAAGALLGTPGPRR
jgi:hypothetical protein